MGFSRALLLSVVLASCRDLVLSEPPGPPGPGTVQAVLVYARPGRTQLEPAVGAKARLLGSSEVVVADNAEGRITVGGITSADSTLLITFDADLNGADEHQRLFDLSTTGAGRGRDTFLGIITLGRNAEITGRVLRGDRATPGGHGGINLFVPEAPFATSSADDGTYSLTGLPEGRVTVAAFADGYEPFAQAVTLRAGEELRLAEILLARATSPQTGELRGSTVQQSGEALSGVTVTARSGAAEQLQTTGGDGTFAFLAVSRGVWTVRFEKAGFRSVEIPNVLVASGSSTVAPVTMLEGSGGAGGGAGGGTAGGGAAGGSGGSGGSGGGSGGGAGGSSGDGGFSVTFRASLGQGAFGELRYTDGGAACPGQTPCTVTLLPGPLTVRAVPTHRWS